MADHVLLFLWQVNCGIRSTANVVYSILLHEVLRHICLIMDARQRTSLQDANRLM